MRDGIMEQIVNIPSDVRVLVIGSSGIPDLKSLNRIIGMLNHPDDWIDCECEDHVPTCRLKSRHGLLLIMSSTKGPVLANLKKAARGMNIPYLNQALTTGEVKQILNHLHEKRAVPSKKLGVSKNDPNSSAVNGSVHQEIEVSTIAPPAQIDIPPSQVPQRSVPSDLMAMAKQMEDLVASEQLLTEENARLLKAIQELQAEKDHCLMAALEDVASKERQFAEEKAKSQMQKLQIEGLNNQLDHMRKALDSIGGLVVSAKRI